jgi:hypothetical protein
MRPSRAQIQPWVLAALLAAAALGLTMAGNAEATFPGTNGRIALRVTT